MANTTDIFWLKLSLNLVDLINKNEMLHSNKFFKNENDNSVVQFKSGDRKTTYNLTHCS